MNQEDQELFQQYIDGALSEQQVAELERRLNSEDEFKENFELYKNMNSYLGERGDNSEALKKLRSFSASKQSTVKKIFYFTPIKVAASLAFLILICWTINQGLTDNTGINVLDYYSFPKSKSVRSGVKPSEDLESAYEAFDKREFELAEQLFSKLLSTNESENLEDVNYYLGNINLIKGAYKAGEVYFKTLLTGSKYSQDEVNYNLALCLIGQEKFSEAKQLLSRVNSDKKTIKLLEVIRDI